MTACYDFFCRKEEENRGDRPRCVWFYRQTDGTGKCDLPGAPGCVMGRSKSCRYFDANPPMVHCGNTVETVDCQCRDNLNICTQVMNDRLGID